SDVHHHVLVPVLRLDGTVVDHLLGGVHVRLLDGDLPVLVQRRAVAERELVRRTGGTVVGGLVAGGILRRFIAGGILRRLGRGRVGGRLRIVPATPGELHDAEDHQHDHQCCGHPHVPAGIPRGRATRASRATGATRSVPARATRASVAGLLTVTAGRPVGGLLAGLAVARLLARLAIAGLLTGLAVARLLARLAIAGLLTGLAVARLLRRAVARLLSWLLTWRTIPRLLPRCPVTGLLRATRLLTRLLAIPRLLTRRTVTRLAPRRR